MLFRSMFLTRISPYLDSGQVDPDVWPRLRFVSTCICSQILTSLLGVMVGELQNWEVFSRPQEEELEWLVLCEGAVSCHIYDYSDINET